MSMLSLDKFVALVGRSKLVDEDRLSEAVDDWKRHATLRQLDDARHCAEHFVRTGLLTDWQAAKLLDGRHRGFFLGKYKLLDHLGSGGMSSVYLAEHVLMQRRVAIKVLPHNRVGDSSYLARFHFEGQAAAALDHRNIVRAYDLDNEGRIHYLVMEYIEGRDLQAIVEQDGPLEYHAAANVVAQAAAGLEHAHQRGLVHRDIKPANLLVDLKGTVKILDMGLAKFTPEARPNPGFAQDDQILGTADYLAPEQAANPRSVDHRADIYALGCTLYFLLSGHPPFSDGTSMERMAAHQQQVPPSLLLDRPDAPSALVTLCRRMMEKSPDGRYQSAGEIKQALSAWLESEAALGHVTTATLMISAEPAAAARTHAKSKANLVSGSAPDLNPLPPDFPQVPSSLQDTDSNLNRAATVKIPIELARLTGEAPIAPRAVEAPPSAPPPSDANLLLGGARPVPPPIVAPPREPPIAPLVTPIEVASSAPVAVNLEDSLSEIAAQQERGRARFLRAARAARLPTWLSALALTVLILAAVALAVMAIAQ